MRIKELARLLTPPLLTIAARKYFAKRTNSADVSQATIPDKGPYLELSHVRALQARVRELSDLGFTANEHNAVALLEFYNSYLPFIRPESRGSGLRTLLTRLAANAPDLSECALNAIAISDLSDGLPDRAKRLSSNPRYSAELMTQIAQAQASYGAEYITEDWGAPSRGASILYYLQSHSHLILDKDVMHVAPEHETRQWLKDRCRYTAFDGKPDTQTDVAGDITCMPISPASFDVVICHRVLEHVLDDLGAMREIFRILRAGGVLNMSVPQAPHRPDTNEWMVQDTSHHDHVRQYGDDLLDRLRSVGFDVEIEKWLIQRPKDELKDRSAFPLRMYNARKPERVDPALEQDALLEKHG